MVRIDRVISEQISVHRQRPYLTRVDVAVEPVLARWRPAAMPRPAWPSALDTVTILRTSGSLYDRRLNVSLLLRARRLYSWSISFHEPPSSYASGAALLSRSRFPLPFFPQYQLVIPLGQNCRPIGDSQWLFSPLHAGTLRCHSDALVHRSTGHQASFLPGKLGDLSQIPFFALTLHCCFLVRSKSEGARGLVVCQVPTCRLMDPVTPESGHEGIQWTAGSSLFSKENTLP